MDEEDERGISSAYIIAMEIMVGSRASQTLGPSGRNDLAIKRIYFCFYKGSRTYGSKR